MKQRIDITDEYSSSGISITYVKSRKTLWVSGWYDSFVGIQGRSLSLAEFFNELGISEKDLKSVFKKEVK